MADPNEEQLAYISEQLEDAKEFGIKLPCLLLRVPMLSEIPEVVRIADVSLNSEIEVLKALNEEAGRQGKQQHDQQQKTLS